MILSGPCDEGGQSAGTDRPSARAGLSNRILLFAAFLDCNPSAKTIPEKPDGMAQELDGSELDASLGLHVSALVQSREYYS